MGVDFQVGKGLVVTEVAIVFRQDVLDQAGFHEKGIDLAFGQQVVDVADFLDQLGGAGVFGRRFEKVTAGAGAEALGLADIDHAPGIVFHEVDARRLGEIADFFRGAGIILRLGGKGHFGHRRRNPKS